MGIDVFDILTLVGGLALFLYGMDVMGDGLKKLAGGKLESILGKLTKKPVLGFLLGFLVTAIIQSSSATTVMLVGFVNSGLMTLSQTLGTIMGANVGTTVTSWLLSLSEISGGGLLQLFKPSSFSPILAAIGVIIIMTTKSNRRKNIASILLGFAVLMTGMETMSGAVSGLKDNPDFAKILIMFENPAAGILFGTILTAIIQSSSASVGILQALSLSVGIPFATAIPIILGQNIGTTITPILASINASKDSKRVAFACLFIKIVGVGIFVAVFYALNSALSFAFVKNNVTPSSIATFHTVFNIASSIILLPFTKLIEKAVVFIIRGKNEENDEFNTLDERFLSIPSIAIENSRLMTAKMGELSLETLNKAIDLINDFKRNGFEELRELETKSDRYEDKIGAYLIRVAKSDLHSAESKKVSELLHVIGDFERISDHALNIGEAAEEIYEKKLSLSQEALTHLEVMANATKEIATLAITSFIAQDGEKAKLVEPLEEAIDRLKRKIKSGHIKRLTEGVCSAENGFVLSDLITNYERVGDHASNIALYVIGETGEFSDSHEYAHDIKNSVEFKKLYESYKEKYKL